MPVEQNCSCGGANNNCWRCNGTGFIVVRTDAEATYVPKRTYLHPQTTQHEAPINRRQLLSSVIEAVQRARIEDPAIRRKELAAIAARRSVTQARNSVAPTEIGCPFCKARVSPAKMDKHSRKCPERDNMLPQIFLDRLESTLTKYLSDETAIRKTPGGNQQVFCPFCRSLVMLPNLRKHASHSCAKSWMVVVPYFRSRLKWGNTINEGLRKAEEKRERKRASQSCIPESKDPFAANTLATAVRIQRNGSIDAHRGEAMEARRSSIYSRNSKVTLLIGCPFCYLSLTAEEMDNHFANCPSRKGSLPSITDSFSSEVAKSQKKASEQQTEVHRGGKIRCPYCKILVRLAKLSNHLHFICPKSWRAVVPYFRDQSAFAEEAQPGIQSKEAKSREDTTSRSRGFPGGDASPMGFRDVPAITQAIDLMDAHRGEGSFARENGRFGSHAIHDRFDDESAP